MPTPAAPTAWGYNPDAPVLSGPQVLTFDQTSQADSVQGDFSFSLTSHDEYCHCWDCVIGLD